MNISPEVATEIAKVVVAFGVEAWNALNDDGREAVLEAIERNRTALAEAPEVLARIRKAEAEARSKLRAAEQARGEKVRDRFALTDTMRGALAVVVDGHPPSHAERADLRVLARFLDASLNGELDASGWRDCAECGAPMSRGAVCVNCARKVPA